MSAKPPITPDRLIARVEELGVSFSATIDPLSDEHEIRACQAKFLGKKGAVSQLMKGMGQIPGSERKRVGAAFNKVKAAITDAVAAKLQALEDVAKEADLARAVDVTLPGRQRRVGHMHLLTQVREQVVEIFSELGFEVAEGPQVETDFHSFEALAMPKGHPARAMQDTFYIADSRPDRPADDDGDDRGEAGDIVLRPHTSPVQIRVMESNQPPIKVIAPGVVYRRDDDVTHSPMFSQLEGLLVDETVRLSDLKGIFLYFIRRFFGKSLNVRFRPSYFPFVEPGVEVDMQCAFCMGENADACRMCKGTGFIEISGAGMVDPDVFRAVGYDIEKCMGLAWGMGLERIAMLRHNVTDIKYYYEGDLRFLRQF